MKIVIKVNNINVNEKFAWKNIWTIYVGGEGGTLSVLFVFSRQSLQKINIERKMRILLMQENMLEYLSWAAALEMKTPSTTTTYAWSSWTGSHKLCRRMQSLIGPHEKWL